MDPVGTVIEWIGEHGVFGLFVVSLAERFLPILPSYGLLLGIGIKASEGEWSLPVAYLATLAGSIAGFILCFYIAKGLGHARSIRLLHRSGRLFGLTPERLDRWIAMATRHRSALAFLLQLVPTVRLLTPALAPLTGSTSTPLLCASAAGIAVWNGIFIGIGYFASNTSGTINTTAIVLAAIACFMAGEALIFWIRRRSARSASACEF